MSDNPEALQRMLHACRKAAEWLEGWATAEPYLSILEQAIADGERALAAQSGDAPPPLPPAIMYGRCAGLFTADQMRERDAMWQERLRAALAQQAATPLHEALADQRRRLGAEHDATLSELARVRSAAADEIASLTAQLAAARQAATPAPAEPEWGTQAYCRTKYAAPQITSAPAEVFRALDGCKTMCERIIEQYGGWPQCGVDFNALLVGINRGLVALAAPPATPAAQPADGWTITAPDGQQWSGPTPFKAASAARLATISEEEARASLAKLQACAAQEAADMQAEHEHLNCPACGGSGHVEDARAGWIAVADRLPDVRPGSSRRLLVACRRKHSGKTSVFEAEYLNGKHLADDGLDDGDELGGRPYTGWYEQQYAPNEDSTYVPVCADGDEVTHWLPLPAAPALEGQG